MEGIKDIHIKLGSINYSEFSKFGNLLKQGYYDKLDRESYEWVEIWQEQLKYCLHGYSVGGLKISGRLYSYINFGSILRLDKTGKYKNVGLPDLRDIDIYLDSLVELAIDNNKHLMVVSGRRLGKSCYGSWLGCYYSVFTDSHVLLAAGREDKLLTAMNMTYAHILGLKDTEFFIPILRGTTSSDLYLGYSKKDEGGKFVDVLTGGVVYGRNFRNDFTIANGLSVKYCFIDEIGMFDNLIKSYEAMKYCWKDGNRNFGFCLMLGTGGDMEKGSVDAYNMFINPEAYDLLVFREEKEKRAFFVPGYMSFNEFRNKGIIDIEKGIEEENKEREKLKKNHDYINLYNRMQYSPLKWEEAFLRNNVNDFPVPLLQKRIEDIMLSKSSKSIGYMTISEDGNNAKFVESENRFELLYPMKHGFDPSLGGVIIYEHPEKGLTGDIPMNKYIAGLDPYIQDKAAYSPSIGSCYIMKIDDDYKGGTIVAEYNARPQTINEFYEQVRLLLVYYNAKCLYENMVRGFKEYMELHNSIYYVAKQPMIIQSMMKDTQVNRNYGVHMNAEIKKYNLNLIKDYLLGKYQDSLNINRINSISLLQELINYHYDGNFDRVDAFGVCLLYLLDLQKNYKYVDNEYENNIDRFFKNHFKRTGWTNRLVKSYINIKELN